MRSAHGFPCAPGYREVAFTKILRAAFSSLSSTNPHPGQRCVRTERDFFTCVPHLEQFCVVYCGSTAMTGTPYTCPSFFFNGSTPPQPSSFPLPAPLRF